MKLLQTLKLIWRNILATQEARIAFFQGNQKLLQKKFDALFRIGNKQGVEIVFFDSKKELIWVKKDGITVIINDYYSVFIEVLVNKGYSLPPYITNSKFCVFDMGMNRGYASLFFANYPNCTKVFSFELEQATYNKALQNFALNETLSAKIVPYNFGLWNADDEIDIFSGEKDGRTCATSFAEEFSTVTNLLQDQKYKTTLKATVKKASGVVAPILNSINADEKKVLKIDIEGAEYAVFEDLYNHKIIQQFDVIIGECHNGIEELEKYLEEFVRVNFNVDKSSGLITFCYINKRIYL